MYKIVRISNEVPFYHIFYDKILVSCFFIGYNGNIDAVFIKQDKVEYEKVTINVLAKFAELLKKAEQKDDKYRNTDPVYINLLSKLNKLLESGGLEDYEIAKVKKNLLISDTDKNRSNDNAYKVLQITEPDYHFHDRFNNIGLFSLDFEDTDDSIKYIVSEIKKVIGFSIKFDIKETVAYDSSKIRVKINIPKISNSKEYKFCFWNSDACFEDKGNSLHIEPSYAVSAKDWELINGATNANIANDFIASVFLSKEASRNQKKDYHWSCTKHPYYAKSKSFEIDLRYKYLYNKNSLDYFVSFVLMLLNKKENYVCILGGFEPEITCAHNIRNRGYTNVEHLRGSEASVIWQYLVLKKEAKLNGSKIPNWFWEEKWLLSYSNYYNEMKEYNPDFESVPEDELLSLIKEYDEELFEKEKQLYTS